MEHFTRQPDDNWLLKQLEGLAGTLDIASIACRVSLAELYDRVTFPEPETDLTNPD